MVDTLSTYRSKRDFKKTAEPSGEASVKASNRRRFVIQKHDATRLHYDLRLELDGVFKSWAVTKGPSPDPHDKRRSFRDSRAARLGRARSHLYHSCRAGYCRRVPAFCSHLHWVGDYGSYCRHATQRVNPSFHYFVPKPNRPLRPQLAVLQTRTTFIDKHFQRFSSMETQGRKF